LDWIRLDKIRLDYLFIPFLYVVAYEKNITTKTIRNVVLVLLVVSCIYF